MKKIGGILLTQAPSRDIKSDILSIVGDGLEFIEVGVLDGLSRAEIIAMRPELGEPVLTDLLLDGTPVVVRENYVISRIQNCIDQLEKQGVELIVLFCGGDFSGIFHSTVPIIFPLKIMQGVVPLLTKTSRVAIMAPLPLHVDEAKRKWKDFIDEPIPVVGSPHEGINVVRHVAEIVRGLDVDLAVLDCFGFTIAHKKEFARISGKLTVSSRTLTARIIAEMV